MERLRIYYTKGSSNSSLRQNHTVYLHLDLRSLDVLSLLYNVSKFQGYHAQLQAYSPIRMGKRRQFEPGFGSVIRGSVDTRFSECQDSQIQLVLWKLRTNKVHKGSCRIILALHLKGLGTHRHIRRAKDLRKSPSDKSHLQVGVWIFCYDILLYNFEYRVCLFTYLLTLCCSFPHVKFSSLAELTIKTFRKRNPSNLFSKLFPHTIYEYHHYLKHII